MHRPTSARDRGRRGRRLLLGVVVAVAWLSTVACSSPDDPVDAAATTPPEPTQGGSVVVGTGAEIDGLNPMVNQWSGPGYIIGRAVMDPLVVMDRDGAWQPYLAEAITPNMSAMPAAPATCWAVPTTAEPYE